MGTPLRLLMVEDSTDDAELTVLELGEAGFDVDHRRVDTEEGFLAALGEGSWDVVISDYQMPTFNGLKAYELFRKQNLDLPFIFVSGALGEDRAVEAMRAGARDYIVKGKLARLSVAVRRELQETHNRRRQREAEAATAREQRCLAMAMEATGAGVVEMTLPLSREVYLTGRWSSVLGFEHTEVPPHDRLVAWFTQRIHPEDREAVKRAVTSFVAGQSERLEIELRVQHKDGHYVDVAATARAIERRDQVATRIVGVLQDLAGRKKLEAQLRQAVKMEAVGRLAGGIAHDFNNLLTVILGYSDLMLTLPGTVKPDTVSQIHRAATRASELTRQLLAFSRNQIISPRPLDLNSVVNDTSAMIKRLIGEDIDFLTVPGPSLWKISADPGQIEQVLMNLVVNARDAMAHGGKLTVETRNVELDAEFCRNRGDLAPGHYVMLAVSDTGTGISPEVQAKIFEPFFTTKEKGKGTGLGLATVYGILKQNRAHVAVYSEVGKGTTFKIYWPQSASETIEPAKPAVGKGLPRGTEIVLLVEDEAQVRELAARVLSSLGYTVIQAEDGIDAQEKAKGARVDLVVTDVVMPRMGGKDLARALGPTHPGVRVIYASGYTANAIVHQGVLEEGVNFLPKPYTPQELAQKVRAVLDSR
ncbi:MAG: response regulator [Planctomycetes bacterium]|nr:response regulator [Planctomycetota bacterium]